MKRISIIIPAYKEEDYIEETLSKLDFIRRKSDGVYKMEIIVVVNGEKDNTENIAQRYANKVIHSNMGPSAARNKGAAEAQGEIYVFLDADTQISENLIEEIIKHTNEPVIGTAKALPEVQNFKAKMLTFIKNFLLKTGLCKGSNGIIFCPSETFKKSGGFDERLFVGEIHDFYKRALKHSKYIYLDSCYVIPSLRRYEKEGYLKTLFFWIKWSIFYLFNKHSKVEKNYDFVR